MRMVFAAAAGAAFGFMIMFSHQPDSWFCRWAEDCFAMAAVFCALTAIAPRDPA